MKIKRKEDKFTEKMLNDMYAEKLLEKWYEKKYEDEPNLLESYLSLTVWVSKDTGIEFLCDMNRFDNYEECKEDDKVNHRLFSKHTNAYTLFITGKRIEPIKDKPMYIVIEAEAIEG